MSDDQTQAERAIESTGHKPTERERALTAVEHALTVIEQQAAKARVALAELKVAETESNLNSKGT